MTAIDRGFVVVGLLLLSLIGVAMGLAGLESPFATVLGGVWIVFVELAIYFILTMAFNAKATVGMGVGSALVYAFVRGLCAILGGIAFSLTPAVPAEFSIGLVWVNPISAIFQVALLVFAGPYLLAYLIPEMVGRKEADRLLGNSAAVEEKPASMTLETSPTGGFIQVFSYEELTNVVKKSQGLEGFVLFSTEGLVVWRDLPMRIDVDALVARLMNHSQSLAGLIQESGLTRMRRVALETRDHHIYVTTLNQNFGMLLIFGSRVSAEEVLGRIAVLAKSAREFLQWKYPALPMAAGLSRERVPMDIG